MQTETFINDDYSLSCEPPSPTQAPFDFDYYNNPQHSPFSGQSDLSDDFSPQYNPSEYDLPGSLLMFPDEYSYGASGQPQQPPYGDYSSPSSNGGDGQRSRGSSISSQHYQSNDVTHSFADLSFRSPNWSTDPLPSQKPQSPPRLLMPDNELNMAAPPTINAPDGDGDGSGPKLHIVPATPVSGGGLGGTNHVNPFTSSPQRGAATLSVVDEPMIGSYNATQTPVSQQLPPPSSSPTPYNTRPSGSHSAGSQSAFLFPTTQQRMRSKSDPPVPVWDADDSGLLTMGNDDAVNMNDVLQSPQPNTYLTPDGLRRVKSDARMGHRSSRSEDSRTSNMLSVPGQEFQGGNSLGLNTSAGMISFPSDFNMSQGFLSPQEPPPPIRSHGHSQSLSNPSSLLGFSPNMGMPSGPSRHHRRASSGSRSERGTATWNTQGTVPSEGYYSHHSSNRGSPYPSPNASPRVRYDDLPREDALGLPLMQGSPQPGQQHLDPHYPSNLHTPHVVTVGGTTVPLNVSKQNVTTVRTSKASQVRRKQEATFACPVVGCGSTFTRSFNLKGHIRSHNEEKPFLCHWPGCGKGFARQHDCKRHEQLHTNFRPFTCDGCQKPFARMDALNRHLRSEGGAECQKLLEATGNLPAGMSPSPSPNLRQPSTPSQVPSALPVPITSQGQAHHIPIHSQQHRMQATDWMKMDDWNVGHGNGTPVTM